jgi:hypothetical protein
VGWLAAKLHELVIAPDLFAGLTHQQLDELELWLEHAVTAAAERGSQDELVPGVSRVGA